MVLLTMPAVTLMPPTCGSRSTTATCFPSFEAWIAARWPAGPDPITTKS